MLRPVTTPHRHAGAGRHPLFFALLCALAIASTPAHAAGAENLSDLTTKAANGDPEAQFQLGTLDYVGLDVVQDYVGAVTLLKQAATAGNAEAACEVGFLYQTGSFGQGPPPPDPADALPWYQRAAKAGNPCGQFALAAMYASGTGVKAAPAQANALFAQAAAQGFKQDPSSFPLEQLQDRIYATAYKITGYSSWVDAVSVAAGGSQ